MTDKRFFYLEFAQEFDAKMNRYDLSTRLKLIFYEELSVELKDKLVLDAGSGTGWFSREAEKLGGRIISLDMGIELLKKVKQKCQSDAVAGDVLDLPFKKDIFDVLISTEVIEHTVDPKRAVMEMCRVLKPGGKLILTTPNIIWIFAVWLANLLKLRPYKGYENWVSRAALKKWLDANGLKVEIIRGFHLFPFVSPVFYPLLGFFDRWGKILGPLMLNIGIKAEKQGGGNSA
ncbi:MAG: class I SAM-dependent methyltransferase [Candidatus Omnitrophica bacterium]|nr:class I SAM-dependent methyltransferase [Candidatus Omnitrophota bacterium]